MFTTPHEADNPWLPLHIQQFVVCCLFHFLIPLLPFAVEYFVDGRVSPGTLTVGAAVYVLVIGNSSRSAALFGISVALGIIYTILFGLVLGKVPAATTRGPFLIAWSVGLFVFFHGLERFKRHVMVREPYWEFANRREREE